MAERRTTRIGLTGGIAAGKSEVQRILLEAGVPVLDTDTVAHEVMQAGTPVHAAVVERFGPEILLESGEINRRVLGGIVFGDAEAREDLNRLVHPEVRRRWRGWLEQQSGVLAVVSIPLLFECGYETFFDGVLCVWSPEEMMKKRLLTRGLSGEQANQRIQSQWLVDAKREASTWSIHNDKSLLDLRRQVLEWLERFQT